MCECSDGARCAVSTHKMHNAYNDNLSGARSPCGNICYGKLCRLIDEAELLKSLYRQFAQLGPTTSKLDKR